MMIDFNEATVRIRAVGASKTRIIPAEGASFDGLQQIQVLENDQWVTVATNVSKVVAEQIVQSATNKVILG